MIPTRTAPESIESPEERPSRSVSGPEARRRVGESARTWGLLTLGSVVVLTLLVLWHLARRGRWLRSRLGPPRMVQFPPMGGSNPADPSTCQDTGEDRP